MQLTKAYTRFLRKREGRDELIEALKDNGYELEVALLNEEERAFVGPTPPEHAEPGDIWMDTVELMPMVLIPFEDTVEPIVWLAMRPVARWQFAGFMKASRRSWGRKVNRLYPFDGIRLLEGPETEPITNVTREEASLYAQWFGKLTADRVDWQLAKSHLEPDVYEALWGPVREWNGYEYEEVYSVVDATTVDLEDVPDELIFYPVDAIADVGFRTELHLQTGLITRTGRAEGMRVKLWNQARRA